MLFVRLEHGESRGEGVGGKRSGAERDYSTRVPKTPHVWQTTRSSPCDGGDVPARVVNVRALVLLNIPIDLVTGKCLRCHV